MVDPQHHKLSVSEQCHLLSIHRSGLYYKPRGETLLNMHLMKIIDREFFDKPFYGVRRMTHHLKHMSYRVNKKRIERLYRLMDLRVIYPKKHLSKPGKGHTLYPYLLKGLTIDRPNQVWSTDITWIPMKKGFMYMIAIIDLYSRYVVNWSISNSMDAAWCREVLTEAIEKYGAPEIFNTDQGSQFSSLLFTDVLKANNVRISMDGKGRAIDNIFIERLWRSVKYEYAYLNPSNGGLELYQGMKKYMDFYNNQRPHQSLKYQVPKTVFEQHKYAA
jgi:putative transposase